MTARLIILNVCWLAVIVWATFMGYVSFVFNGDGSYVSYLIAVILAVSLVAVFKGRSAHLQSAQWLCETLGFVGTLIGITVGLSGVGGLSTEAEVIAAGNALFSGVATAFCSTITGAVAMLWLWSVSKVVGAGRAAA